MAGLVVLNWPFLHVSSSTLSWKAVFIRCSSGSSASEEHKNFDTYFPLPHVTSPSHFYPLPVFQLHIGLYISGKDIKVYKINTSKVPFAQLKKSCRLPFTAPCFYLFIYLILNSKAALILLAVMWACEGLWSYFPADLKSSAESHSPGHISSIFRTPDPFCKRDQALLVPTCSYLHLLALECMVLEKGFQKRSWLPYTACPL